MDQSQAAEHLLKLARQAVERRDHSYDYADGYDYGWASACYLASRIVGGTLANSPSFEEWAKHIKENANVR